MLLEKTRLSSKLVVCGGLVVYLAICARTMTENAQLDLFVYRTGAQLALEGLSPYATATVQMRVADQFPPENENDVANNCGFFLPPQAIVVFLPFARMEWEQAQAIWFFFLTMMGLLTGILAYSFGRRAEWQGVGWPIVVLAVLLNPITMPTMVVGQTGLLFVGCIALGQYAFETGSPRLGCFLWAIPFLKPHLALPFLILAWILGGWRRAAGIAVCVAILNLFGGLLVTGTLDGAIGLFRTYVEYVGAAHKTVKYNLVAENFQIPSWNRAMAALGGPAIDLKIWMTLTGFAVWGLAIAGRLRLRGELRRDRLDPAYLVAVTAVGALFFAQVLAYEMILLVLVIPLILQHFDADRRGDASALIAILLFLMIPLNLMDQVAGRVGWEETSRARTLMRSHRSFGMAMLSLWLLIRGPGRGDALPVPAARLPGGPPVPLA